VQGFSTEICKVGGTGSYQLDDFRTILSFDTSFANFSAARISGAVLTITRQSLDGNVKPFIVDIKAGTFAATTALNQMAYYGFPSVYNIGSIEIPDADGSSSSFEIPASSLQFIGVASRTQFMLRQDLRISPPSASPSILQIFDGQATLTLNY